MSSKNKAITMARKAKAARKAFESGDAYQRQTKRARRQTKVVKA